MRRRRVVLRAAVSIGLLAGLAWWLDLGPVVSRLAQMRFGWVLLAVAISVAVRCDPCIAYHVDGARKHGATREEIAETLGLAIYMGAGPSAMYAAQALEAYDQFVDEAGGGE